jgi:hypothetical protein
MLEKFTDFQVRGGVQLTSFHTGRADIETRLHAMRDRTLHAFHLISDTLVALRDSSRKVSASIEGVPGCREHFAEVAVLLHQLHDRHDTGDEPSAEAAGRSRTYTMASEHAVHAAVFGGTKPSVTETVELFDKAEPPTAPGHRKAAPPPPVVSEFGQNAELF